jgi:hypothetical protein
MSSFEALAKQLGDEGNSELLIVSFDIGTTQCERSIVDVSGSHKTKQIMGFL